MKRIKRSFRAEFKAKVAIEALKEQKTISELAQQYELHPTIQYSLFRFEEIVIFGKN